MPGPLRQLTLGEARDHVLRRCFSPSDDLIGLETEWLVVADGNGAGEVPAAAVQPVGGRVPFEAPSFTTFTDMQDIILLDPVHEVDARGWPHAPAGA